MGLFSLFSKSKERSQPAELVPVDIHSHLLPGLDDGAQSMDESIELIKAYQAMGFQKAITTPHMMEGFYSNTPQVIATALEDVRAELRNQGIDFPIEAACEYYFDEHFVRKLKSNEPLLTFGDKYVLFETAFLNEPVNMTEVIAELKWNGYRPILAHPERYSYLNGNWKKIEHYFDTGVLFQINILSLIGYYDGQGKKTAERLIDSEMVHFVGSDCHRLKHLDAYKEAMNSKYYDKLMQLSLLNRSL